MEPEEVAERMKQRKTDAAARAYAARAAATMNIGVELMNRWNRDNTDPSLMAVMGHSTMYGFEFCIERDGVVHTVKVERNLDS